MKEAGSSGRIIVDGRSPKAPAIHNCSAQPRNLELTESDAMNNEFESVLFAAVFGFPTMMCTWYCAIQLIAG